MTVNINELLTTFEALANAGPDREIFQAYIKDLFADGSGKLHVELASTQVRCDEERLLNRLFCPAREFLFTSLDELTSLLTNMDLVNTSHPEHEVSP